MEMEATEKTYRMVLDLTRREMEEITEALTAHNKACWRAEKKAKHNREYFREACDNTHVSLSASRKYDKALAPIREQIYQENEQV